MPTPPSRIAQLKQQQQAAHHLISEEQHRQQVQQQQARVSHQRDQPAQQHPPELQELVEQSRQLFQQPPSEQPDQPREREEQQEQQDIQQSSQNQDDQANVQMQQSNWYSLPDQAFMTLAEDFLSSTGSYDATFEHGRIFDSASWCVHDCSLDQVVHG